MIKIAGILGDPAAYCGPIEVGGWVRTMRESKNICFIALSDGTAFGAVQVVAERAAFDDALLKNIGTGAALAVRGELVLTPDAPQPCELIAQEIKILGACDPDYPLQKKRHSLEFLRGMPHLRPRTNTFQAAFRVRSIAAQSIHRFFDERGFLCVHTPIITGSDCEGAGEMLRVSILDPKHPPLTPDGGVDYSQDFFGTESNLTVSGQLHGEAFALAFRDIYTFGPTFRAEDSNTARHAAEFWMVEPEMAFCDLAGNMDVAEAMVKRIISDTLERAPAEMEFFNQFMDRGLLERLQHVRNTGFERVSYTDAVALLEKAGAPFQYPVYWGCDLQTEHERYLTEQVFKKPVFVTDYPKSIKAFYMRNNEDGKTVAAMDLLVPGVGELIGGSQREERLDVLQSRMDELCMDNASYGWYYDLRRFGGVYHAGYGMGFERMVMYLTGIANIRDVLPFPRTAGNMGI